MLRVGGIPGHMSTWFSPVAENLGLDPARPSGLDIRPRPDPTMKKPVGPWVGPLPKTQILQA